MIAAQTMDESFAFGFIEVLSNKKTRVCVRSYAGRLNDQAGNKLAIFSR